MSKTVKNKKAWNNTVQIVPTYEDRQANLRHVNLEYSNIPPLWTHYNFRDEAIPGDVSSKVSVFDAFLRLVFRYIST